MKALVTGGCGFIGGHLVESLHEMGVETHVVDMEAPRVRPLPKGVHFYQMDIRSETVRHVIAHVKPDILFHFAAQVDVNTSMRDPLYDANMNIVGTLNLLKAASDSGVQHFVFASSSAVYGESADGQSSETDAAKPVSYYGLSKWVAEMYIQRFHQDRQLPYTIFRFANVYGPRQSAKAEGGVISIFVNRLNHGDALTIYGDGMQKRDFIFVGDIVRANLLAMKRGATNDIYNVSTGRPVSILDLADNLSIIHTGEVVVNHEEAKIGDSRFSCLSNEKIKKTLGWVPSVQIEEGLRLTYEAYSQTKVND